jgi:hypothetical protein
MAKEAIPKTFFNMIPTPIAVTKPREGELNSSLVFANKAFFDEFGWQLNEIPDKQAWWEKAYPDEDYRKVVVRQWELAISTARENNEGFVSIELNIMTKLKGQKRFNVYTHIGSQLISGYHVVGFGQCEN